MPTYDEFTIVIVLTILTRTIGIVVDAVSDVITLSAEHIKPAPQMSAAVNSDYLNGLATIDDRLIILVDIDRLMSSDEMGLIDQVAA